MYKFKEAARRGSALFGAATLLAWVGATAVPAFVSADALNPLTERSLSLSSSSPGWSYTDGSGNSTYAGPNTGANGQKTGNTFSFRASSDQTINSFTFQYCTTAAGLCAAPGNDTPETWTAPYVQGTSTQLTSRGSDSVSSNTSDLAVQTSSPSEVSGAGYKTLSDNASATATGADDNGGLDATVNQYGSVKQVPDAQDTVSPYNHTAQHGTDDSNGVAGNFVVLYGSSATGYVNTYSGDWTMSSSNSEDPTIDPTSGVDSATGKSNLITLKNTGSGMPLNAGDYVKVMFFGTDSNYITNPGAGAFFVKINDYSDNNAADVVDGGVTVANVMNQSIEIQTKVLETMDFSVGTVDPDTLTDAELTAASNSQFTHHGACNPILTSFTNGGNANVLTLGNSAAENSLKTDKTFATHSYWRLSSNSSGGATVYYAGNTLSNTEGDKIAAIGTTAANPSIGSEQFGLALDNNTISDDYAVNYDWATPDITPTPLHYEAGADEAAASHGAGLASDWDAATIPGGAHDPQLFPLEPIANYGGGTGGVNTAEDGNANSSYAFDPNSQTVPTAIASEDTAVVNCVTGKMRYIANIAATTPAGIYTTKINYIAAPQY